VIPIFAEDGAVAGMYGRKITPWLRAGTPLHLYLPGPHRGVWNWEALATSRTVILCEALIDALTFWCAGLRNVTAAYGVEGFTAEHLGAFGRHGVEQVLIAFDRDEAGDRGAEKVAAQLMTVGIECYRVQFPRGMDANDYARKTQPADKALELVLRAATWMGRGAARTAGALAVSARKTPVADPTPLAAPTAATPEVPAPAPAPLLAASAETPASEPTSHLRATPEVPCEVTAEEVRFAFGDRRYRVRGLARNTSYDALKVNLLSAAGERFHVDTFDVYAARQRAIYLKQAAVELGVDENVLKADLQSEGELTIASTGKDPETGKLITQEYRVEGPVMIFLTTTAIEIDEELLNRCLVLTVDEERGQTQAIHERQREGQSLEGLLARKGKPRVLKVHQDAQRLLRPLAMVNPYARALTFPDHRTRTRRDHMKYLGLIRTIALLHQHQRPVKTASADGERVEYVEVTVEDIAVANRLAHQVLGRSLDELAPQTRRLLGLVDGWVRGECGRRAMERKDFRFSRREVRAATGWGATQTRIHLDRLVELEYVAVHRGGNGTGFVYELANDGGGADGAPHLTGLLDVEALRAAGATTIGTWRGSEGELAASLRAGGGGVAAGWRGEESRGTVEDRGEEARDGGERARNARQRPDGARPSYVVAASAGAR